MSKPTNKRPAIERPSYRQRAACARDAAGRFIRRSDAGQPQPASLPRESGAESVADAFQAGAALPQDPGRGHPEQSGRAGATGGPAPRREQDMGRHETFENAAPIAQELLAGTIAGRAPHPTMVTRAEAMCARAARAVADPRISSELRAAIEAHREASVAMLLNPDTSDEAFKATTSAFELTEERLRDAPALSMADLHCKLAFMLPDLLEEVNCTTVADYLKSVCEDAAQLAAAEPMPGVRPPLPSERALADSIDFGAQTMSQIMTIADTTDLVGDVARAVGCQPRTKNTARDLMEWISEACDWVVDDARAEARSRATSTLMDRETRLKVIARADIGKGDAEETWALARDVASLAVAVGAR